MPQVILEIDVEEKRWQQALPDIEDLAQKVKDAAFAYVAEHENIALLQGAKPLLVNVCLSNDAHVHELNRDFRNMDKPTNVLSFANLDYDGFADDKEVFDEIALGDIIIAYETMVKEAEQENISLHDHFCHLLTHGFLHILGFDHIEDDEAEYMEGFEREILQTLGVADPYGGEK